MDLLSIADLSSEQLMELILESGRVKHTPSGYMGRLRGKSMVMLFEKPSTRTRLSFEVAFFQLGGHPIFMDTNITQLRRGETVADSARVIGGYVDFIVARVSRHETLIELAENSEVPVINALSDLEHPCQVIGDLFTIYERGRKLDEMKLAYVGDGNNVCNSLILGCAMSGVNISVASPKGYEPDGDIVERAVEISRETGSVIEILTDPQEASKDADFLYTDVWVSMGDEKGREERVGKFRGYQVNDQLLGEAKSSCRVMHCLPAHRGMEITDDVLDGPKSIVWEQAENRLHAQKAILMKLSE